MPASNHESDSEEDLDYVPEGEERDSDTEEERDTKRPRVESPPLPASEDLAAAKSERLALWAKFQDSVNAPAPSAPPLESDAKRMIKIEKRHRFAGEDVVEVVEVPEDSADAKKWPLWKKPPDGKDETAAQPTPTNDDGASKPPTSDSPPVPPPPPPPAPSSSSLATPESTTTSRPSPPTTTTTTKQQQPRPGRRKPKQQLAEVPSAASRKGLKRLTTLEKSALDWKAHVDASSGERERELAAELEANRRGGGYLEKVEFLQRVGDRKNQALETNLDHKRRRG